MNQNRTKTPLLARKPKQFSSVSDMIRDVSENEARADLTARKIEERHVIDFLIGMRTARELSQNDVAAQMNCTQSKVSKLESGIDDNMSIGDFNAYVRALGLETMIVLGKRDRTLVQRVNAHANSIRRLMMRLAESVDDGDDSIEKGAMDAFVFAAKHLSQTLTGASEVVEKMVECLPVFPREEQQVIQIQSDADDDEEMIAESLRVRSKRADRLAC